MRRRNLAVLLSATMVFTTAGCRQTTGPIGGGPVATGPLSPVNPGQQPFLGPFGSNTRVTPPATGSYQGVNSYTGASIAPVAQPSLGVARGTPALAPVGQIGSGVQVAGWTETNATISNGTNGGFAPSQGTNPSVADPRSGGMRVNDLTGAPAPPGYRPTQYQPAAQNLPAAQYQPSGNGLVAPVTFNPVPLSRNPMAVAPQQGWQDLTSPPTQNLTPAPSAAPAPSTAPAPPATLAPSAAQGPSTEPVSSNTGSSNLDWRRPGSQF